MNDPSAWRGRSDSVGPGAAGGMTRNQSIVLAALKMAGRPMKAYDILEAVRNEGVKSPMTVYRALDDLTRFGLVAKISSMKSYVVTPLSQGNSIPIFLICEKCNSTSVIRSARMEQLAGDLAQEEGFEISQLRIEVMGNCCK